MQLTKYEHACFVVEKDGKAVVVDPGTLTTDFIMPDNVVAIVITHIHGDHLDENLVASILEANPGAVVIGPAEVTTALKNFETRTVHGGDNFTIDGVELEFYGDTHALQHPSLPPAQNVGVLIDERVYYPGDAFAVPEKSVDTLALPIGGGWLKISEPIDFMTTVAPRFVFPTHDAVLASSGQGFADDLIARFASNADIEYQRIDGETIEID